MGRICAVAGCSNGTYQLERWKGKYCKEHNCMHGNLECTCSPPFTMFPFPTERQDNDGRLASVKAINRTDPTTGRNWVPKKNDRVCSSHFVDQKPTKQHPCPSLSMGYKSSSKTTCKRKAPATKCEIIEPTKKKPKNEEDVKLEVSPFMSSCSSTDHDRGIYTFKCPCTPMCKCPGCLMYSSQLYDLTREYDSLKEEKEANVSYGTAGNSTLKPQDNLPDSDIIGKFIASDSKVRVYTGLPGVQGFQDLFIMVSRKASQMRYWCGVAKTVTNRKEQNLKKTPTKPGPGCKTTMKEELLMVLMKLRMDVRNEMLADIFGVSPKTVSQIFNTWMKLLSQELKPLIFWPSREAIQEHLPESLAKYPTLRCTIDCTEVFIRRPQNLEMQALTWSDYKKHNTVKFLVGIAPNGAITFLSKAWGGRASDKKITNESGFLDGLDAGDIIMADRDFTIHEELIPRGARLLIPPPSSGLDQMTRSNVLKTKEIANARIHVERAIDRMKEYSILQNVLPVTLLPLIDDIIVVCAALCNLMPPLVV